jgi:natural product biosynthesis luciferase-like monooxygenase protein/amino acid adenylation domain-containing protein
MLNDNHSNGCQTEESQMLLGQERIAGLDSGLEVAVIGMAGRFPSAPDIASFWQLLREGREGLTYLSDEQLEQAGVSAHLREDPRYVRKRGVLARKHVFDADLFGYTINDAQRMDPQFCVLHEVAWEALESAGYQADKYDGLIGLFAGGSSNLGWVARVMRSGGSLADYYSLSSVTESGYLSTRVAHRLNLTGPAITTNTTCSTSLVNIHLACQALIAGECDVALAGGVSVSAQDQGYLYQDDMVLSPDGSCRPFDAAANGTGAGEGCGIVVLKRLEDASADNDHILAVIKGSAINNDGQRKVGFTAPSTAGQARVIRAALARAAVDPHTISYIEAHGTATKLGDPIEIAALKQVFGGVPAHSCAVGSVKSNIGHLGEAAGVAGFIKTVLALQHRTLPPSLNFNTPNPHIGLEDSPFYISRDSCYWANRTDLPRRAGVSSFGLGGTNAHVVLEESISTSHSGPGRTHHPILLSANSEAALQESAQRLIAFAQAHPETNIADLAYTLHVGRKHLPWRGAFVVSSTQELARQSVSACQSAATVTESHDRIGRQVLLFFSGSSGVSSSVTQALYESAPAFRRALDECLSIASLYCSIDFRSALLGGGKEVSSSGLMDVQSFMVEFSLAKLLAQWGYKGQGFFGVGAGEIVAACVAGVFELRDALALIMAQSGLRGCESVESVLIRSSLMKPSAPLVSNLTGTWIRDAEAISRAHWQQPRQHPSVDEVIAHLSADGPTVFVQVGPGPVLAPSISERVPAWQFISLVPLESCDADMRSLLDAVCQLYRLGVYADARGFYEGQSRARIPLPVYPFEGRCHYPLGFLRESVVAAAEPMQAPYTSTDEGVASDAEALSVEDELIRIWKEFLGVDHIDVHEDVFNLGVDSLLSIRAITEMRKTFNADLSLDTIFLKRTVAEQAAEIERRIGARESVSIPPIVKIDHGGVGPLSTSQRRLWIISHLERDHTAYNTGFSFFVRNIQVSVLERAFRELIVRHSILRTVYEEQGRDVVQRIREQFDFHITQEDISGFDPSHRYEEGQRMWQAALLSPIDLRSELMIRVSLVRCSEDTHLLIVTQHHICSDNWSTNLLMQEISTLYDAFLAGQENPLPTLPVQYIDYAYWQDRWLRQGVLEKQIPFWKSTLAGIPAVHNLPLEKPRPKYQSYLGTQYSVKIDGTVLEGLNHLSQQNGATLFMTMQAAFSVFLARYSGEDDIVTGFSTANRLQAEMEGLIGFFVNTLVLRANLAGNPRFVDFLGQTKTNLVAAYAHSHVPFEVLVDELKPVRSMSYEPITQIKLVFLDQSQDQGGRAFMKGRAEHNPIVHADMQVPFSKYDLTLYFGIADGGLSFAWEYATDLFTSRTIERMARDFETLLRSIISAPETPIRHLALLADEDIGQQLRLGNAHPLPKRGDVQPNLTDSDFGLSLFYFASDDGERAEGKYHLLMQGARFADQNGFVAIWTPERHFDSFGGAFPNPAIAAAAVAAITTRVKVRAGSCVLPLHNPVRVAEDWSVIDNLSGGRVGIGFAAGYSARDFCLAPTNFADRRDVLIRDVAVVKALWRGESLMLPSGNGTSMEIRIRPRPIQPELPVWTTTVGNDDAFRHAGRMGNNVLTHLIGQSLEALAQRIALYRTEWVAAGHAGTGTVTLLAHTFIANEEGEIRQHVKEPFKRYLVTSVGTPLSIAKALGMGDMSHDVDAVAEFAYQRYAQNSALLGTAERCAPIVQAIRAAGVNELACLIDFGVEPGLVVDRLDNLRRLRDMAFATDASPVRSHVTAQAVSTSTIPREGACIHQLFEEQVKRVPEAPAVVSQGEVLSYSQLNARANQLAHLLLTQHSVKPDARVGLCVERSIVLPVGIFGILKSGAAYVPIEPSTPSSRVAHMAKDADLQVVVTTRDAKSCLSETTATLVYLEDLVDRAELPATNPQTQMHAGNLAYVIYTSGSSGLPKGVMVEHYSAVNFWNAMRSSTYEHVPPGSRVALSASFAFDMSLKGILQLLSGHCLFPIPQRIRADADEVLRFLSEHRIDAFDSTPSQLGMLLAAGLLKDREHYPVSVLIGGEPINQALWDQLAACSRIHFYNMYGPTECTVDATIAHIEPEVGVPHIGSPIQNVQIYLLDAHGQLVPHGAVGEIHVGGAGLARGYLNQPQLTEERFIRNAFSADSTARLYKTGDLARWRNDGSLVYVGRNDLQIKLRGFRLELGEIESRLVVHPQVIEAAVLALGDEESRHLVACIVCADPESADDSLSFALKREITTVLPAYMVPQTFVFRASLPLTVNGKLDREALSRDILIQRSEEHVPPRTPTEEGIAAIWCEVMRLSQVSVNANFFEVGGHSLVAIRVVNDIANHFGVELPTRFIFEYSTVETLATYIDTELLKRGASTVSDNAAESEEVEIEI